MRESDAFTSQRSSSIRLRKRRDKVKQEFVKHRRSGEFGYRVSCDAVNSTNNTDDVLTKYKDDTLDPGPVGIQHNLRTLLRNKYVQSPVSDMEGCARSLWGTGGREQKIGGSGIKLTNFGMIDHPPQEVARGCQYNSRYELALLPSYDDDDEEDVFSTFIVSLTHISSSCILLGNIISLLSF